jgi:hypothetical protein
VGPEDDDVPFRADGVGRAGRCRPDRGPINGADVVTEDGQEGGSAGQLLQTLLSLWALSRTGLEGL